MMDGGRDGFVWVGETSVISRYLRCVHRLRRAHVEQYLLAANGPARHCSTAHRTFGSPSPLLMGGGAADIWFWPVGQRSPDW